MDALNANIEYFKRGEKENQEFWDCLGGRPDFSDRTVIDLGCGHGSLCVDIASVSPRCRAIGLDTNAELIDFAKWNLHANYPALESRVEFHCVDLENFSVSGVDAVLSKASFEHILNLDEVLGAIKRRLKPRGRVFAGFEPLYPSPFGGHGRIHNVLPFPWLPWGHLMVPEKYILKRVNRLRDRPVSSIKELGLNQLSVQDYRRLFEQSGLAIVSLETNAPARSIKGKALNVLKRAPFLERYVTYSLYAILENPG